MRREHIVNYNGVGGYFDRRIERFVEARGRRIIGWDDILQGGVSPRAAIMSWHRDAGALAAVRHGNDVVVTPDGPLYLDAYQGDPNDEPQAIGDLSTPEEVYQYRPAPALLDARLARHILGVQANLWSEYVATPGHLFYMLLPRMLSLSEIAWRNPQPRDWSVFEPRMNAQLPWLAAHGYNFRIPNPEFALDGTAEVAFGNVSPSVRTIDARAHTGTLTVRIASGVPNATIRYTLDGTPPGRDAAQYVQPLSIALTTGERVVINAVTVLPDGRISTPSQLILTGLTTAP
jgi:hexosaminidase